MRVKSLINNIKCKLSFVYKKVIGYFFIITQPIKNNKIVICNFYGKGYGCNPKYIVDEILKQKLTYDIVWLVDNIKSKNDIPSSIRVIKYGSIKSIYELATAKLWIDNSRKFISIHKRKHQYYIQTWHAGIALKKVEKDTQKTLNKDYIKYAKIDSKNADLFISNSKFITELYQNSFWYDGEILESGIPRNDILFNKQIELKNKINMYFNIPKNKKIIMYAPTFRKDNNMNVYEFDYEKIIKSFEEKFLEEYVMIIRLHPNILNMASNLKFSSHNIINGSLYPDMQELLAATDILITDYSSSMFDFALTRKPCFIYANDIESYNNERGFYFNLNELPFDIATNNLELIQKIEKFNYKEYLSNVDDFLFKVGCYDEGKASEKVVQWIKEKVH